MAFWKKKSYYNTVPSAGWRILEYLPGSWQQNVEYSRETVLAFSAVFSCVSLISSDISKLRLRLTRYVNGVWEEVPVGRYRVIEKPNSWQNRIQFLESWVSSKFIRGNAYILKQRDSKDQVERLYVLNPDLVTVLVSDSGEVFYRLNKDQLSNVDQAITVPASEIIHDRFNCFYHPLVGLSPITACGLAAYQGLKIQENSANFFENESRPSGILTAPGAISDETAARLKVDWETNYSGDNTGKVAVLGDDLKYIPLSLSAEDAQMVEQLKLAAETVATTFHVPTYKIGGALPNYNNVEALEQQYFSQCLQHPIESIELCLDEGLEVEEGYGIELDLEGLLRMDTATKIKTYAEAVKGGLDTPNEARRKLNQRPLEGGDTIYLQEQYYSLQALAKRDANDPFDDEKSTEPTEPEEEAPTDEEIEEAKMFLNYFEKGLSDAACQGTC